MNPLWVAVHWAHYASQLLVAGACLFMWPKRRNLPDAYRCLLATGAALCLLSGLAWWIGVTREMAESTALLPAWEDLRAVLTSTQFGHSWSVHLALNVLLLLAVGLGRWRAVSLVISTALLFTQAAIGHMGVIERMTGHIASLATVHLIAATVWLGGLMHLCLVIRRGRNEHQHAAEAISALQRFSSIGAVTVPPLLIAGALGACRLGIDPLHPLASDYGIWLSAKLLLMLSMLLLAAVNRWFWLPRLLVRPDIHLPRLLAATVGLEFLLGLAVLAIASVLGMQMPPGR